MDRRALLGRILLLAGATLTAGGCSLVPGDGRDPDFKFSQSQFALLSAYATTLVPSTDTPGANDVDVAKNFESLMRDWASGERQQQIVSSLETIDKLAREQANKGFADLDPVKREEILKPHDVAALKVVPPAEGEKRSMFEGPPIADPGYGKLKRLVLGLYFFSEPVQTEVFDYQHAPGRWDPSVPVTPETRPAGGTTFI